MKVLVVDDSPAMRKFIIRVVGMTGLPVNECGEAGNGAEAMNALQRSPYDIILTDINMPGMDGEQFLNALQSSGLPVPPVIVVSTDATDVRMDRMRELGAVGYVAKPFTPEQFRAQLAGVLAHHVAAVPAPHRPEPGVGIIECAAQVLETMFFCPANPAPGEARELAHTMGFGFFGGHPGRFIVTGDRDAVLCLAENFLGLDESEVDDAQAGQLIGELANMICGTYLSRAYPDSRFHLGSPQPMAYPAEETSAWLELERGFIGLAMETRAI